MHRPKNRILRYNHRCENENITFHMLKINRLQCLIDLKHRIKDGESEGQTRQIKKVTSLLKKVGVKPTKCFKGKKKTIKKK